MIEKPMKFPLTKVGFDLDGTLDHSEIGALARLLYAAGVEIHVITVGGIGEDVEDTPEAVERMYARKIERLAFLDVPFTKLHVVTGDTYSDAGYEKAAIINGYEIPIMIDDASTFVSAMVEDTTALILHLKPGGNDE
jgi:hypothetical protein